MKKIVLFFFVAIPFLVKGISYTSNVVSGNWNSSSSWSPVGIPGQSDNVTILLGNTILVPSTYSAKVTNLTVNGTLSLSNSCGVWGLLTNTGTISGTGILGFHGSGTIATGSGNWASYAGEFFIMHTSQTIDATCNMSTSNDLVFDIIDAGTALTLTNNGNVTVKNIRNNSISFSSTWVNNNNSSLTLSAASFTETNDALTATASGNTVIFSGTTSGYVIPKPTGNTYYNLTGTNAKTLALSSNITISNNFTLSSGIFDVSSNNYNITVGGNITNNGTINNRSNTVTLNGSAGQTIGGTSSTTFYNLIASGTGSETATLGNNITISNNFTVSGGTLDCQTYQITGNATGTLSMASGTNLLLGTTASASNVSFPTNFTSPHIALNAASTVKYLANTASQVISVTPTYGNLIIDAGSAVTKTPSGTPLNVGGNLTINTNPTLSETSNTLNVTGSATINGTLSFTTGTANITGGLTNSGTVSYSGSGNLNIGGNFTNNGTFTPSTGIVTMNGSAGQTIGGTSSITFYDLTIAGGGGETVSLNTNESITDVLTVTSGVLGGGSTMTLISTSGATARIAQLGAGGSITAPFIAQRYESARGSTAQYATLSTPFTNAETVGDWNTSNQTMPNKFYMSISGGANGLSYYSNGSPYYSVYTIDETKSSTNYAEYVPIKTASTTIAKGQGIYVWLGTSLTAMSKPFTYIQHGVPNTGTISVGVTKTSAGQNGFNLIGNPYASPISWSQFQTDNAGLSLQNRYYVMGSGGSWENSVTNGLPNAIPMCQGFGIVVGVAGTVNFNETQKTSGNPALNRPIKEESDAITFVLSNDSNEYYCPTTLTFGSSYAKNYDPSVDAYFIHSYTKGVPILYTVTENNDNMLFKALPDADKVIEIPLTAIGQAIAKYTLTIKGLERLTSYQCVNLIDKKTGQLLNNFNTNPQYSFYLSADGQEKDFVLRFTRIEPTESCNTPDAISTLNALADNVLIIPSQNGASVNFNLSKPETATISVYNILGAKVIEDLNANAYNNNIQITLPQGQLYIIRVQTASGITVKRLYH